MSILVEQVVFEHLNFDNLEEVKRVAYLHEIAPVNWNSEYVVSDKKVSQRVQQLIDEKENMSFFCIVAKLTSGMIVGIHWLELEERYGSKCAHIYSLWVDPKYREKGIGRQLKEKGEEWAKQKGAEFVATDVFFDNKKMIDYNIKLGFKARQVEMIKDL